MHFSFKTTSAFAIVLAASSTSAALPPPAYETSSSAAPSPVSYAAAAVSQSHMTVHYTRTSTITHTEYVTLTSSTASHSVLAQPSSINHSSSIIRPSSTIPSSSTSVYTLPTVSHTSSPITAQQHPEQTHTFIGITSSSCSAGQTVTQSGSVTVLPTPSISTYLTTTVLTGSQSLCPSSQAGIPTSPISSGAINEPNTYVPVGNLYTASLGLKSSASQQRKSSIKVSKSTPTSLSISASQSVPSIHGTGSPPSGASPSPASVPYPSSASGSGSGAGSVAPSGTMAPYPSYSSVITPYNPNGAATVTPSLFTIISAAVAMVVTAVQLAL